MKNKLIPLTILVIFFNLFFFHHIGNLGYVLASSGLFAFTLFLFNNEKREKLYAKIGLFSGLSLLILFRSNFLILFFSVITQTLIISTHLFENIFGNNIFDSYFQLLLHPVKLAIQYLKTSVKMLAPSKENFESGPKKNLIIPIIRGVLIAAPVLIILIALLTSADPIYFNFLRNLFNLKINFADRLFQRIIFSLILFLIFLPVIFLKKSLQINIFNLDLKETSLTKEMIVVSALTALTLGSFLFIQFKYIFINVPAETELIKFGINTYSEYVRRGFIELIFASFLVYLVTKVGLEVVKNSQETAKNILLKIQVFGLFELLIFILSIFRRIWLYQSYHGLSVVRIYGGIFLFWISAMTIALIFQHFLQKNFIKEEIAISIIFVFILGTINVENIVATSNYPPTVNGRVDYVYLSGLPDEGSKGWIESYNYAKNILADNYLINKSLVNREERREVAYAGIIVGNLTENYDRLIKTYGSEKELKDYLADVKKQLSINQSNQDIYLSLNTFYTSMPSFSSTVSTSLFYSGYSDPKTKFYFPTQTDHSFMWNYSSANAWQRIENEISFEEILTLQKNFEKLYQKISSQPENERGYDFDISLNSFF